MARAEANFDARGFSLVEANTPAPEVLEGATVKSPVLAFDDTTEEYANLTFQVPHDIDTSGTVTFRAHVLAKTAAADKNVALTFGHRAIADGEDFDGAYTDEDSGDQAIDATQDDVTVIAWTETVANLGWAAGDLIFGRFSRPAAGANNLVGDMYLFLFVIEIPLF